MCEEVKPQKICIQSTYILYCSKMSCQHKKKMSMNIKILIKKSFSTSSLSSSLLLLDSHTKKIVRFLLVRLDKNRRSKNCYTNSLQIACARPSFIFFFIYSHRHTQTLGALTMRLTLRDVDGKFRLLQNRRKNDDDNDDGE